MSQGWWLIQRLEAPRTGALSALGEVFSFGGGLRNGGLSEDAMNLLRGIFSFDYMGAAEFEFGAVPKAFRDLAKSKLSAPKVQIGGCTVYALTTLPVDVLTARLQKLYDEPYGNLKAPSRLKDAITKQLSPTPTLDYVRTKGWLVLEDKPCMFFIDQDMWKNTCTLFGVNPD